MKRSPPFSSAKNLITGLIVCSGIGLAVLATLPRDAGRDPAQIPREYGLAEYVNDCERELGRIPNIHCMEGQEIPILDSDHPQPDGQGGTRPLEITHENYSGNGQRCDSPSQLQEDNFIIREVARLAPCVPHTRLGTGRAQEGFPTKWVWSCRRYFPRPREDKLFDDINMIGHNPETGATCYFVTRINRFLPTANEDLGIYGEAVPSPSWVKHVTASTPMTGACRTVEECRGRDALRLWKTPDMMTNRPSWAGGSMRCTTCHDNDPFIHTPFVQQVLKPDGTPVVPAHPNGPYWMVGDERYYGDPNWMTTGRNRGWQVRRLASQEASSCTMCHSFGDKRTCSDLARWSTSIEHHSRTTNFTRQYRWMPPSGARSWKRELGSAPHGPLSDEQRAAVRFINDCCSNPNDSRCVWEAPPPPRRR